MIGRPPRSTRTDTLFPYTELFRSRRVAGARRRGDAFVGCQCPIRGPYSRGWRAGTESALSANHAPAGTASMAHSGIVSVAAFRPGWANSRHRRLGIHRARSEEHTSELQSLMRISYAVFCLKK